MKIGVVTFPGSLDDRDAARAFEQVGGERVEVIRLWHADRDLRGVDAVVLPGGFSYGDYLRCGAVASRSPVMRAVERFAADGGPVLGICNGFQILCEAGLLPGALLRNENLRFVCREAELLIESTCAWTAGLEPGTRIQLPVKHGEGRYHADPATLDELEASGRVLARYAPGRNPNGSARDIAGIVNEGRNVLGLMPHPEHAVDPDLPCGTDGRLFVEGLLVHLEANV